mmetsp:Transcript_64882/g.154945  ORF Transcript_64882/g.154945 Transcript_64882/m.154945 type:complete len:470 (+) Transcript_64882:84-1493(+)|eukprot:CAMPEP_0178432596 /NCGR_PEP_ID=MMETSP0689_2-20121128/32470_1 /TAXON_ID=160604 /ORGANISM="Amphidinium massartii, Strain CS-259" /LENGTH=469 /DNA_ID=CAMNT_0020054595 /DNA_START=25 /DNA_END=1434 /DNA_ORIENTATION=+
MVASPWNRRGASALVGVAALASCASSVPTTPPMRGWMTWERFTCEEDCTKFPELCIGERLILTTADAMVSEGFVAMGYNFVQIDDCWLAKKRDENGNLQPHPDRFPRGIKYIADYLHARGMKLGLYTDIGSATCCGLPSLNVSAVPDESADKQLQADIELMQSWGMDSLKVDGCNANPDTMNLTYPKLAKAMEAAAAKYGVPRPWYSCSWPDYVGDTHCPEKRGEPCVPLHMIAEYCDSSRIYNDICDAWEGGKTLQGVKNIIDFWMTNPQLAEVKNSLPASKRYFHDPDQLIIGNNGLSKSQAEVQMGMWVMFAAPLVMSNELRNGSLDLAMKNILLNEEVLALSDDTLGLQATQCLDKHCTSGTTLYDGTTTVWNKTLADGSVAVALLNTGNFGGPGTAFSDFNISFTAKAVGLECPGNGLFKVRDLFKHMDAGTYSTGFWSEVDTNSIRLVRLTCLGHQAAEEILV